MRRCTGGLYRHGRTTLIVARMINAWAETVPEKPSFRRAFRSRRCLIPADGSYEWRKTSSGKQPYYMRMEDGSPFAFAGLWESWKNGREIRSCAIITTEANEMEAYPVSRRVNSPSNDAPDCVQPVSDTVEAG